MRRIITWCTISSDGFILNVLSYFKSPANILFDVIQLRNQIREYRLLRPLANTFWLILSSSKRHIRTKTTEWVEQLKYKKYRCKHLFKYYYVIVVNNIIYSRPDMPKASIKAINSQEPNTQLYTHSKTAIQSMVVFCNMSLCIVYSSILELYVILIDKSAFNPHSSINFFTRT